ncbi:unnamed protein product [Brassica rapa subsp. trilocularis]
MLDEYEFMDSLVEGNSYFNLISRSVRGGMTDEQCHQLWESGKTFFHAYVLFLLFIFHNFELWFWFLI